MLLEQEINELKLLDVEKQREEEKKKKREEEKKRRDLKKETAIGKRITRKKNVKKS